MSGLLYFLKRNHITLRGAEPERGHVTLEWWQDSPNAGDAAAPYVYKYMLESRGLRPDSPAVKCGPVHLMTIGSIIGMGDFDAVIWGSGIHTREMAESVWRKRRYVRYDIRAVRGPVTAETLRRAGYTCPDIYGDPAVLLPEIYQPENSDKKYKISLIRHYTDAAHVPGGVHEINIKTNHVETVLDEITASEMVISSSLHGIIFSEAYGVPAVFLGEGRQHEMRKYADWYEATGRPDFKAVGSLKTALRMDPQPLPDLKKMREELKASFPADLWRENE